MNFHIYYNKTTGKKVQTIVRATAVPSMQDVICYQELYDEYDFFVISREDFQNEFTREPEGLPSFSRKELDKRVEIPQKTRRIEAKQGDKEMVDAILTRFLDAETYEQKINILREEKGNLDKKTLNNIAICLDLSVEDDSNLYEYIIRHLELQMKYEGGRLR